MLVHPSTFVKMFPKTHFGRKVEHKAEVNQDGANCLRANIVEVQSAGNAGLTSRTQSFALTVTKELLMLENCCFQMGFQNSIKVQLQFSATKA